MTSRPSWPAVPTTSQASDAVVLDGDDDDDAADDGLAVDLGAADAEPDAGGFAGPPHADAARPTTTRPPRSEPLRCAMDGMFEVSDNRATGRLRIPHTPSWHVRFRLLSGHRFRDGDRCIATERRLQPGRD